MCELFSWPPYVRFYNDVQRYAQAYKFVFGLAVLMIGVGAGGLLVFLDWAKYLPHFLFGYWIFAIGLTFFVICEKRSELQRAADDKREALAIADMKFWAEIWAGFTLVALAAPMLQLNAVLEEAYPNDRLTRLTSISTQVAAVTGCAQLPYLPRCKVLARNLNSLEFFIARKAESEARDVIAQLDSLLEGWSQLTATNHNKVNNMREELNTLRRGDEWLHKIVQPLPILSLLFAVLAVSSKVALAIHDKETKERDHKAAKGKAEEQAKQAAATKPVPDGVPPPPPPQAEPMLGAALGFGLGLLLGLILHPATRLTRRRQSQRANGDDA